MQWMIFEFSDFHTCHIPDHHIPLATSSPFITCPSPKRPGVWFLSQVLKHVSRSVQGCKPKQSCAPKKWICAYSEKKKWMRHENCEMSGKIATQPKRAKNSAKVGPKFSFQMVRMPTWFPKIRYLQKFKTVCKIRTTFGALLQTIIEWLFFDFTWTF